VGCRVSGDERLHAGQGQEQVNFSYRDNLCTVGFVGHGVASFGTPRALYQNEAAAAMWGAERGELPVGAGMKPHRINSWCAR